MSRGEFLDEMLADLERRTLPAVRPPGTDALRRRALRRQRNRLAATALAAVVAVGGALGAYLVAPGRGIGPAGPGATTTPPFSASMPADLHLSGPTELTLTPNDGRYHGTLTLTLRNTGPIPYGQTLIYLSYPDGVDYQFPGQPLWGPCLIIQGDEPWVCNGPSVPARGGTLTITWAITVDYAPGPAMTLPLPFTFRAVAAALTSSQRYPDPTPADNRISVTLKLAAA